jgi:CheY-like chemotaxis protein
VSGASHFVNCTHCKAPFNALTALWCSCLASERSLVCPGCLQCFCKAPALYKEQFWENSPLTMRVRRDEEHKRPAPKAGTIEPSELRRPLVLVVDDEAGILRLAIRVVRGLGYSVIWCEDGQRGLEMARQYRPEIVLTDALMPHLDGREMCRRIKDDPELQSSRVIVMTGVFTSPSDVLQGRQKYGVDDYLSKPIDFKELGSLVQKHAGALTSS